jgi:hypothetical protein
VGSTHNLFRSICRFFQASTNEGTWATDGLLRDLVALHADSLGVTGSKHVSTHVTDFCHTLLTDNALLCLTGKDGFEHNLLGRRAD